LDVKDIGLFVDDFTNSGGTVTKGMNRYVGTSVEPNPALNNIEDVAMNGRLVKASVKETSSWILLTRHISKKFSGRNRCAM